MPWEEMMNMRNKLIHGYFEVDMKIVWKTIVNDIPSLKTEITSLLSTFKK